MMDYIYFILLLAILEVDHVFSYNYSLTAAIAGYKGSSQIDEFRQALKKQTSNDDYCQVEFLQLDYDQADGTAVFNSLEKARSTLNNDSVAVVLGPYIDVFTSMAYVITKQAHLMTEKSESSEASSRSLPILPDSGSLSDAVAKIIADMMKWENIAFLSQNDFSPVPKLSRRNVKVWPIRLPQSIRSENDKELMLTLTNLRSAQKTRLVLHSMDSSVVKFVIKAAEKLLLLHNSLSWFITYLDFADVASIMNRTADIYGLQLLDRTSISSSDSEDDLRNAVLSDTVALLRHFLHQKYDCSSEPLQNTNMKSGDVLEFVENLPYGKSIPYIGANSQYVWTNTSDNTGKMRTQYSFGIMGFNGTTTKIGNCTFAGKDITILDTKRMPSPDNSLKKVLAGQMFTVITRVEPPFVMKAGRGQYYGFSVDVLNEIAKLMNFDYKIKELDSFTGNRSDAKADWDTLIKQLIVGNASMAIGSLAVKSSREEQISFSFTIISSTISMLSKRPVTSPVLFQFLWPFSWQLWVVIIAFYVVAGGALWVMSRYDVTQNDSEQQFNLKESIWYSANLFLGGGTEYSPQTTSMRTMVAFFWFCTLVITAAYTANLAAYLTLQQQDTRIKTLDKLSKQMTVKYGLERNSDLMYFFKNSSIEPYERMWATIKLEESIRLVPDRETGVRMVKNGVNGSDFNFLDLAVINEYASLQQCDMQSFDQNFKETKFSMGFPNGAPYKDDINRAILTLKERGSLDDLKKKWWDIPSTNECKDYVRPEDMKKPTAELDLDNMLGVFIVLLACVSLSVMIEISKRVMMLINGRKKGLTSQQS
ncbi:glutamate receptor ionotropic, kainate 2-like [Ostrea edulis]|uniref:glutamate receptor ionotropic, kainate 2-like n=1 Tax=Ostrea edulis TaxID=37623 RepID=UPI0024B00010|nr:glutamate receptor ionotropic, kainate 2-like [Ostrea edulis]